MNPNNQNNSIDTNKLSESLRLKAIDPINKSLLITNFHGSEQEEDLSEPANCDGFGRIRHFKLDSGTNWPINPLPILPAAKALGINSNSEMRAQVFQNSVCNWRCWYCFVDFKLLSGNSKYSKFLTSEEMLNMYLLEDNPPQMIDLSGGQPDLTPEWVPWMMEAITERGLQDKIYLWSDDNLSNDYFWKFLTPKQIDLVTSYKMYSRVCCFKGIDDRSFGLNTKADPKLFNKQVELSKRLLEINLDLYCYITLTANTDTNFDLVIPQFLDRIQTVDELLPLRIVPLKVYDTFTPIAKRMDDNFKDMLKGQFTAIEVWQKELSKRFSPQQLLQPITEVSLKKY